MHRPHGTTSLYQPQSPAEARAKLLRTSGAFLQPTQYGLYDRSPPGTAHDGPHIRQHFVHCIFSTKERRPLLAVDRMPDLFAYLGGIAKGEGFDLIAAGGMPNHIHLLISAPPKVPLATAVQKLKGSSSRWMGPEFSCQEGYGAFSVSPSQVPVVKQYIRNQERHHRKRSFEEAFSALQRSCGVDYDEQFVFGWWNSAVPTGLELTETLLLPTLKRGANDRCASGAIDAPARKASCLPWRANAKNEPSRDSITQKNTRRIFG